ncbi:cupin domain-containing protein [Streptomyces sp. NPDC052092]|uniref:cupin domain-containing protein n=1 Tax=Streptomyces sp. NPDC052092 TaxID=3365685 RepID=UPI0037D3BF25
MPRLAHRQRPGRARYRRGPGPPADRGAGPAAAPRRIRPVPPGGRRWVRQLAVRRLSLVAPATSSSDHDHGESETAIHVVSGHPEFVFPDGEEEVRLRASPGDYIFVPPYVPHREENPDPSEEAVVVIARNTQEAIVVNFPKLYPLPAEES